jgi:hypothetical protein
MMMMMKYPFDFPETSVLKATNYLWDFHDSVIL